MLWWQGPTLLNPHFAVGTKDQDGSRIFYEPLAAWDPDGNLFPLLAAEIPICENGGLAKDGKSVTWKLKQGVKWHDGKPFTADDVRLQLAIRHRPGDRRDHHRQLQGHQGREGRRPHGHASLFDKPTPFWADAFVGVRGMIIPKHLFADYNGAKSRDAPANLKPVGTGPYKFVDFKPGDMVRGEINPELPHAEPAALRHDRDEGRRRRGLGGARGAADRRIRLRLEPAGRGRDPAAPGEGRQGHGRDGARRQHRAHPAQHHRPVDRGGRRARQPEDQASVADRPGGAPGARPAGRPRSRCRSTSTAAPASRPATSSTTRSSSSRRTPSGSSTSTRRTRSSTTAGWKKGSDGIREKDGKKLKFVYQTSINTPRQKTQAIVKQACQKAGIDLELKSVTASVFFSSDVANPDTYPHFYCDIQMYTTTMTQPDPETS